MSPRRPPADGPVRTCVGCRRRADQALLVRLVAAGTTVEVDRRRRAPGRGAYLHPDPTCVAAALKRRAFGRALRAGVDGPAAAAAVTAYLEEQALHRGTQVPGEGADDTLGDAAPTG